jgi:hypothetical protein
MLYQLSYSRVRRPSDRRDRQSNRILCECQADAGAPDGLCVSFALAPLAGRLR